MKWIDLRENFVRENVINGTVSVRHIPGKNNTSDMFTKEFRDSTHYMNCRDSFMQDLPSFLHKSHKLSPHVNNSNTNKSYKSALTDTVANLQQSKKVSFLQNKRNDGGYPTYVSSSQYVVRTS